MAKKIKRFDNEERKYWNKTLSYDVVKDIFDRRGDKTSCVHNIARIFVPNGKMNFDLTNIVCDRVLGLRRLGVVKLIRVDKCDDLNRNHNIYRLRKSYERADNCGIIKNQKKIRKQFSNKKTVLKTIKPALSINVDLIKEIVFCDLSEKAKLILIKKML